MGRQVPAVERALEILELLADHPREILGLSEIARTLTMNKASCHATLTLLADRGYLIRHADKTYSLGPAILPLANSFLHDQDALPQARVEMAAVSRELNLDCMASCIVDDEIVVLAHTSSPGSFGINMRVGARFPLVPPVGTVFLAWANRERVRQWLAGVGAGATAAERERYLDALAVVRDRGYSVAVGRANGSDAERPHDIDDYLLFELREAQRLPVAHIAAPVFDPEGTVRLALTVVAFHDQLTSQDVPIVAKRLVTATTRVARAHLGCDRHRRRRPRRRCPAPGVARALTAREPMNAAATPPPAVDWLAAIARDARRARGRRARRRARRRRPQLPRMDGHRPPGAHRVGALPRVADHRRAPRAPAAPERDDRAPG